MQKIKIFTTITLLFTTLLSAQGFKLSDYQAPEISRKALWVEAQSRTTYNYLSNNNYVSGISIGNSNISLQLFGNQFYQSKQFEIATSSSYQGNVDKIAWIENLKINNQSRWYFKDNFFVGIDPNIELISYDSESMSKIDLDATISLGWGRMEHTEDARLAIYIFDELKDKELLATYPTKEQIIELAALITKLKNERFLDTREKKIYEITQLDAFFQTNNLLKQTNATYFTILTDNWENCASPVRLNGMSTSAGLRWSNDFYRQEDLGSYYLHASTPYSTSYDYVNTLTPCLTFEWSKPITLKWQIDNTIKTGFNFISYKSYDYVYYISQSYEGNNSYYEQHKVNNDTTKNDYESAFVENDFKLGYYLDSRNSIEGKLHIGYGWENSHSVRHSVLIGTLINWDYYYSKNLRLITAYRYSQTMINHLHSDYYNYPKKIRNWDISADYILDLGITYSLF